VHGFFHGVATGNGDEKVGVLQLSEESDGGSLDV
jgi:hypothetical protein